MFIIGQTYENRRGRYVVLAIRGNKLDVRYEDGTTAILDAVIQKRIISNLNKEHDSRQGMTAGTHPRKSAPSMIPDWIRYDIWNRLLFDRYFNADVANRLVYIDIDEEELARLAPEDMAWPPPLRDFTVATLKTLDLRRGHLLDTHFRRLQDWIADGANSPPPFMAVLVLFCLVAQRMKTDEIFHANNYYDRLAEMLLKDNYTRQKREDIRVGFEHSQELWQQLEIWLISQSGRFGLPSARPMYGLAHVGYPISQALLRANDRQKLPEFFWEAGFEPGQELPPADMERLMTHWVPNSTLSQAAKASWRNNTAKRRMAEVASLELSSWNGAIPTQGREHYTAPTTPIALESWVCGGPRPRLIWGIVFRMPPGCPEVTYEVTEDGCGPPVDGEYTKSVRVFRGLGERWSEPVQGVSIADFLVTRVSMVDKDTRSKAVWQPRKVLVLTWDDEFKVYRSQKHLEFGRRSMVLVYKAVATKVSQVISPVDAGAMRQVPDSWGVPQDWVVFEDVKLTRIPDTGYDADLDALVPEIRSSIVWTGGLALPGKKRWLASRLPTIGINSIEEIQRMVAIVQHKSILSHTEDYPAPLHLEVDGNALDVNLAVCNLTDGVYGLTVTVSRSGHSRDDEDMARQTFEVRSPDWPLSESSNSLGHRSDLPYWTLSAGLLATNSTNGETVLIKGSSVQPQCSLSTRVIKLPNTLNPKMGADQEDIIGSGHTLERTLGGIANCFNGAHYWIIEPVNNMAGFYRPKDGVCKYCGLRERFYPFHHIELLSRQSTRPRREPHLNQTESTTATMMTRAPDDRTNDFDGLLDACLTLGGGSWSQFELLARQVSNDPAFSHEAIQLFSALGHIEVQLDKTGTRPMQWEVAPPSVATTASRKLILSGYRSPQLLQTIEKAVQKVGGMVDTMSNGHGPTAYLITGINNELLLEMVKIVNANTRTGLTIADRPDVSISAQLTSLCRVLTEAHTVSQPVKAEAFDLSKASWVADMFADNDGLYRSDSMPRLYLLRRKGIYYQVSYRVGKHLAAAFNNTNLLAYNIHSQQLECPLGAQLPGLYERAAVLSSGLPPVIDLNKKNVIYGQVTIEVASAIWTAVYTDGQIPRRKL